MESLNLPNLEEFSVSFNRFRGSIPNSLRNRALKVFDVSSNEISGTLDFELEPYEEPIILNGSRNTYDFTVLQSSSQFAADINRFSGLLNVSAIEKFQQGFVSVLEGNVFSCSTLPKTDDKYNTYVCGSRNLEISVYVFVSFLGMTLVIAGFAFYSNHSTVKKIRNEWQAMISATDIISSDEVKSAIPSTAHLLITLTRFRKSVTAAVVLLVVLTTIMYSSLKCSSLSRMYNTHLFQYQYIISAVYLKDMVPAICMLLVHALMMYLLVHIFFRLFISEWTNFGSAGRRTRSVEKKLRKRTRSSSASGTSISSVSSPSSSSSFSNRMTSYAEFPQFTSSYSDLSRKIGKVSYQIFVISLFLFVSTLGNVGYVRIIDDLNVLQIVFVQLALLLFNEFNSRVVIPALVKYLFSNESHKKFHSGTSVIVMAALLSSVDIAIFVATLSSDDLCFRRFIIGAKTLNGGYSYPKCVIFGDGDEEVRTSCTVYDIIEHKFSYQPELVYSGQCRNAVLENYLPVVILSSAFGTFVRPFLYFYINQYVVESEVDVNSKNQKLCFFFGLIKIDVQLAVLPDMSYTVLKIWTSVAKLLTYGKNSLSLPNHEQN